MRNAILALSLTVLSSFQSAFAGDDLEATDPLAVLLANSKLAGACGILDQMIDFQKKTKLDGGDTFVVPFWYFEASRLGFSVKELASQCDKSIELHAVVFEVYSSGENE